MIVFALMFACCLAALCGFNAMYAWCYYRGRRWQARACLAVMSVLMIASPCLLFAVLFRVGVSQ